MTHVVILFILAIAYGSANLCGQSVLFSRPPTTPAFVGPRIEIIERGKTGQVSSYDSLTVEIRDLQYEVAPRETTSKSEVPAAYLDFWAYGTLRGLGEGAVVRIYIPAYLDDNGLNNLLKNTFSGGHGDADKWTKITAMIEYRILGVKSPSELYEIAAISALQAQDYATLEAVTPHPFGSDDPLRRLIVMFYRNKNAVSPRLEEIVAQLASDPNGRFLDATVEHAKNIIGDICYAKTGGMPYMKNPVDAAKSHASDIGAAASLIIKNDLMLYGQPTEILKILRMPEEQFRVFVNTTNYDWRAKSIMDKIIGDFHLKPVRLNRKKVNLSLLEACDTVDPEIAARIILAAAYSEMHDPKGNPQATSPSRLLPDPAAATTITSQPPKSEQYFQDKMEALKKKYGNLLETYGELRSRLNRVSFHSKNKSGKAQISNELADIAGKCMRTNDRSVRVFGSELSALNEEFKSQP